MFKHGFPPEWSTFKKLIWLVGSGIAGASYIWKTVTGTLIHITDALASPMQKCEVTLEPVQDLHGQDAPYPAGGGKNKFNINAIENVTSGDGSIVNNNNGTITVSPPSNSGGISSGKKLSDIAPTLVVGESYYFNLTSTGTAKQIYLLQAAVAWTVNNSKTITQEMLDSDVYLYASGAGTTATLSEIIICKTSEADYSYVPYSNICPITGWTGCEVNVSNENLFNGTIINGYCPINSYIKSGVEYFVLGDIIEQTATYLQIHRCDKGVAPVSGQTTNIGSVISNTTCSRKSFTPDLLNYDYYLFAIASYANIKNVQITLSPSTQETYKVHQGTTLSVTFPDGQTVYGADVELVSGNNQKTLEKYVVKGTENWESYDSGATFRFSYHISSTTIPVFDNTPVADLYCNQFASSNTFAPTDGACSVKKSGNWIYVAFKNLTLLPIGTTKDEAKAIFKSLYDNGTPVEIVALLLDPVPFTTTPQEISTLAGENNIWSNTNGDTTIIYKAQV